MLVILRWKLRGSSSHPPDGLVDLPELMDGECLRAERGANGGVLELRPGAFDCVRQDPVVIEGQLVSSSEDGVDLVP